MVKVGVEVKPKALVAVADKTMGVAGLVGLKLLLVLVQAMGIKAPIKAADSQKMNKKCGL
jgi:hypothetical protein